LRHHATSDAFLSFPLSAVVNWKAISFEGMFGTSGDNFISEVFLQHKTNASYTGLDFVLEWGQTWLLKAWKMRKHKHSRTTQEFAVCRRMGPHFAESSERSGLKTSFPHALRCALRCERLELAETRRDSLGPAGTRS